jgi:hypothetical protein
MINSQNLSNEIDRIKKENDNLQIELRYVGYLVSLPLSHKHTHVYTHVEACPCRHLKGEDITSLKPRELILLEEALENGYSSIRERLVSTKIVIIYFIEGLGIAIKKLIKSSFFFFFFFLADGLLEDD